jgi:hypothetical protein
MSVVVFHERFLSPDRSPQASANVLIAREITARRISRTVTGDKAKTVMGEEEVMSDE